MASLNNMLKIKSTPKYNDSIVGKRYIAHYPLAPTYEVRFLVENQSDFWYPCESYINIEGYITKSPDASVAKFVENGGAHLFIEARYLLNNTEIDSNKGLGIASTMKGLCSFTPSDRKMMEVAGWGDRTMVENKFSLSIPPKLGSPKTSTKSSYLHAMS